jgi:hypothetical protein
MLSFFVFQTLVRLIAGSERITRRALGSLKNRVQGMDIPAVNPIRTQLQRVLALAVAAAVSEGPAEGQEVDGSVS